MAGIIDVAEVNGLALLLCGTAPGPSGPCVGKAYGNSQPIPTPFRNQWQHPKRVEIGARPWLVRKVLECFTVPRDREFWFILQCRQAGIAKIHAGLRLDKEALTVLIESHPGVADSVAAMPSENYSRVESHGVELPPCPQRKVLAISGSSSFEFFWWLPVVPLAE